MVSNPTGYGCHGNRRPISECYGLRWFSDHAGSLIESRMSGVGMRRGKAALFQWVQVPVASENSVRRGNPRYSKRIGRRLWYASISA